MPFGDELIISQRLKVQNAKANSIQNKVKIDNVEYIFIRREFELGFSMIVPESFQAMPHDATKRKFPYEDRPKIIISSQDYKTCIAFTPNASQSESLDTRLSSYRSYIKLISPSNVFFSHEIYNLANDLKVAYYDYRYPVVDGDVYDVSFFADLPDKELLGWFICPVDIMEKWQPLFSQMIKSIQIIEKEDEST